MPSDAPSAPHLLARAGIRAVLFDLDDTLVNTEPLKALSYARAAAELSGGRVTEKQVVDGFKDLVGRPREVVAQKLVERFGLPVTPDKLIELRLRIYEAILGQPDIIRTRQFPHAVSIARWVKHEGMRTGLATMSHRDQVDRILAILNLTSTFDAIVTVDDVKKGKPDPEIYLFAAKALGVPPNAALVVEDSLAGVQSALSAGMAVVAVPTEFSREALHENGLLPRHAIVDDASTLGAVVKRILTQGRGA